MLRSKYFDDLIFMTPDVMRRGTKQFALQTMYAVQSMPRERTIDILSRQLLRCATSVGANYRAACRARSAADFIAKLKIVEEADEIVAIVVATIKTKRERMI